MRCYKLSSITIPNSVTTIGNYTFSDCSSLTSVVIPNSVTTIGNYTFSDCSSLTSVVIPNSVTILGDYTFNNCRNLTSLIIPNSVTSIGDRALFNCSSLKDLTVDMCEINTLAFNGLYISSLTLGGSVTAIGNSAFNECRYLSSVTFPKSVISVGENAFYNCSRLVRVNIPDVAAWCRINFNNPSANPLYYAEKLFVNNEEIKDLEIPNLVKSIGSYTFYGCTELESITLGESVEKINDGAFVKCKKLNAISCRSTNPPLTEGVIFDASIYPVTMLYVPKESINAYENAPTWQNFFSIIEGDFGGINDVIVDDKNIYIIGYYNTQGIRSEEPFEGINIVLYSDGSRRKIMYK